MGNISLWQLAILMAIVLLIFGTKRLRHFGSDLGGAIKGFRKAIQDEHETKDKDKQDPPSQE